MFDKTLRIWTRDSQLALWQAHRVGDLLEASQLKTQLVTTKSAGDLNLTQPIYAMGIQGVFTKALDIALLENRIDLAVHSLKDVPTKLPEGLQLVAVLERGSALDVLVQTNKVDLQQACTIATGSIRRKAQWLHRYPHHHMVNLRGNVQTRMDKLFSSNWEGAVFAKAGLERVELLGYHFQELKWNYPAYNEIRVDEETGVTLRGYKTNDMNKVFACTISHARLWKICVERSEEIMILEHDAIFTRPYKPFEWEGGVLGLNDPRGATHSAMVYHSIVSNNEGVLNAPWVKPAFDIPQGLAGNSAYIIKPYFAEKLLDKLQQKGGWPNDALMCKQFFPNELKVIYPYYTRLQPMQSTTTL